MEQALRVLEQAGVAPTLMGMITSPGVHAGSPVQGFKLRSGGSETLPDLFVVAEAGENGRIFCQLMNVEQLGGFAVCPLDADFAQALAKKRPDMADEYKQKLTGARDLLARAAD